MINVLDISELPVLSITVEASHTVKLAAFSSNE